MNDVRIITALLIAFTASLAGCSGDEGVAKPVPVDSGATTDTGASDTGARSEGGADQGAPDAGVHEGGHAG